MSLPIDTEIESIEPVSKKISKVRIKSDWDLEKLQTVATQRLKKLNAENNSAFGLANKGFYSSIDEIAKENVKSPSVNNGNANVEYMADYKDCLVIQIEDENELIRKNNTTITNNPILSESSFQKVLDISRKDEIKF